MIAAEKNWWDNDSQIIPPGSLTFSGQVSRQQESLFTLGVEKDLNKMRQVTSKRAMNPNLKRFCFCISAGLGM
jgi:hypothetical protein